MALAIADDVKTASADSAAVAVGRAMVTFTFNPARVNISHAHERGTEGWRARERERSASG